jgi:hypothetical protein
LEAADGDAELAWAARALFVMMVVLLAAPGVAAPGYLAALATATTALLTAAASPRLLAATAAVTAAAAVVLVRSWRSLPPNERERAARWLRVCTLAGLAVLVAPVAWRGQAYLWFLMWGSSVARILIGTILGSLGLVAIVGLARAGRAALNGALTAAGVAGVAASVLAPDLPRMLAALDRPLALAPMGASFVHGALAYFDFPRAAPWYPALIGMVLLAAAWVSHRNGAVTAPRAPDAPS